MKYHAGQYIVLYCLSRMYTSLRHVKTNTSNDDFTREEEKNDRLNTPCRLLCGETCYRRNRISFTCSIIVIIIMDDYEYTLFSTVISRVDDEYSFNAPGYHTEHNIFQL